MCWSKVILTVCDSNLQPLTFRNTHITTFVLVIFMLKLQHVSHRGHVIMVVVHQIHL